MFGSRDSGVRRRPAAASPGGVTRPSEQRCRSRESKFLDEVSARVSGDTSEGRVTMVCEAVDGGAGKVHECTNGGTGADIVLNSMDESVNGYNVSK